MKSYTDQRVKVCDFDKSHVMPYLSYPWHLARCKAKQRREDRCLPIYYCRFNAYHIFLDEEEFRHHEENCHSRLAKLGSTKKVRVQEWWEKSLTEAQVDIDEQKREFETFDPASGRWSQRTLRMRPAATVEEMEKANKKRDKLTFKDRLKKIRAKRAAAEQTEEKENASPIDELLDFEAEKLKFPEPKQQLEGTCRVEIEGSKTSADGQEPEQRRPAGSSNLEQLLETEDSVTLMDSPGLPLALPAPPAVQARATAQQDKPTSSGSAAALLAASPSPEPRPQSALEASQALQSQAEQPTPPPTKRAFPKKMREAKASRKIANQALPSFAEDQGPSRSTRSTRQSKARNPSPNFQDKAPSASPAPSTTADLQALQEGGHDSSSNDPVIIVLDD